MQMRLCNRSKPANEFHNRIQALWYRMHSGSTRICRCTARPSMLKSLISILRLSGSYMQRTHHLFRWWPVACRLQTIPRTNVDILTIFEKFEGTKTIPTWGWLAPSSNVIKIAYTMNYAYFYHIWYVSVAEWWYLGCLGCLWTYIQNALYQWYILIIMEYPMEVQWVCLSYNTESDKHCHHE